MTEANPKKSIKIKKLQNQGKKSSGVKKSLRFLEN